jgi:hypothetical protein
VGPLTFFWFFVAIGWRLDIIEAQLRKDREMTPEQLYALLDAHGVEYEIIEIFEGVRLLSIEVNDAGGEE